MHESPSRCGGLGSSAFVNQMNLFTEVVVDVVVVVVAATGSTSTTTRTCWTRSSTPAAATTSPWWRAPSSPAGCGQPSTHPSPMLSIWYRPYLQHILNYNVSQNAPFCLVFRVDALALSVIATATWLGGWVAGCHTPVLYQNR